MINFARIQTKIKEAGPNLNTNQRNILQQKLDNARSKKRERTAAVVAAAREKAAAANAAAQVEAAKKAKTRGNSLVKQAEAERLQRIREKDILKSYIRLINGRKTRGSSQPKNVENRAKYNKQLRDLEQKNAP